MWLQTGREASRLQQEQLFKAPPGVQSQSGGVGGGSPVGEGVPGQVQVGQVGAAASQQSPEQLAEAERAEAGETDPRLRPC